MNKNKWKIKSNLSSLPLTKKTPLNCTTLPSLNFAPTLQYELLPYIKMITKTMTLTYTKCC